MRIIRPLVLISCALASSHTSFAFHPTDFETPLEVIAFGSCNREYLPQPMWPVIARSSSSHDEGGERKFAMMTKNFSGANGRVQSLNGVEIRFGKPDASGPVSYTPLRAHETLR